MDFPGYFAEHFIPEKIHMLNLSFTVERLTENFGGTAGNIAYGLSLLGEKPTVLATIGRDSKRYIKWLSSNHIGCDRIRIIPDELTAGAYIITDKADNQITGFNPGAMKHRCPITLDELNPARSIAIIGPGNIDDMADYAAAYRRYGITYVYDPGQMLPALDKTGLTSSIQGAHLLISNDYELELIKKISGRDNAELLELTPAIITTFGENGSKATTTSGETEVPAVKPRQVVDPTGAGDAYRAGLIQGLVRGESLVQAAWRGAVCASFAVEEYGTQTYRFTPEEFSQRLRDLKAGVARL
jgi:adenosine kinase